ncbi:MAG TPA: hypothetical protein VNI20_13225 [Fimbriimonadaceae bacterium]|nr:hypothetical protein [Fimbriimonadaceae bacterium]
MAATPPTFNPPQQKPGSKLVVWLLVAVAMLCILMAVIGGMFFMNVKDSVTKLISCGMTGDVAKNAVMAYSLDHGGKFPDAEHWQDDILPYYQRIYDKLMKEKTMKDMPSWFTFKPADPGQALSCDLGGGRTTGFSYNAALSGKMDDEIKDRSTLVIFEDVKPKYNASGDPAARPAKPKTQAMGKDRDWLDFPLEGQPEMFKSSNSSLDLDITPQDGLEEQPAAEPPKDVGADESKDTGTKQ